MSQALDFGAFTPAERRTALVSLTAHFMRPTPPKFYPPNKEGTSKEVKKGQGAFAAACWARRALEAIEYAVRPEDNGQAAQGAEEGGGDATPF